MFVSVANEHRIGPGRLWVQLSRRLAVEGFRCVRFDINGFGDSPARDGRLVQAVHMVSAIDDVVDVARAVSPKDPGDVVMFGLCSSGYQILEAALTLSARGVCSLNPSVKFRPPEMASGGSMDARRHFCRPPERRVTAPSETRTEQWLKKRLPSLTSKLSGGLTVLLRYWRGGIGGFRNGPGKRLEDLVRGGTDVLLICGRAEIQRFREAGLGIVPAVYRKDGLQIEVIRALDHGLFPARDRDQVTDLILDHVLAEFQPVTEATGRGGLKEAS
jgi:pimeloyl-ACP methyl ester carboxylesterase